MAPGSWFLGFRGNQFILQPTHQIPGAPRSCQEIPFLLSDTRAAFPRFPLDKPCSLWLPEHLFSAEGFLARGQPGILCVWTSPREQRPPASPVLLPTAWPVSSAEPKLSQDNLKSHHVPKPPSQQLLEASPAPQAHGLFQVHGPFSATSAYKPFTSRTRGSYTWQVYACRQCESHLSCIQVFVIPWTVAHQAALSTGFLQARIQEWVAMPSSRGSSQPRDRAHISRGSCIAGGFFYRRAPGRSIFSSVSGPSVQAPPMTLPPGRCSRGFPSWPASFRGLCLPSQGRRVKPLGIRAQDTIWSAEGSGPGRPPTPCATHTRQPPAQLCCPGQQWDWALTPWSLQEAQQEASQQQNQDKMFSCVLKTNLWSHPTDSLPPPKPSLTIIQLMGKKREILLFCIKGGGKFIALQNFETKKKC